jgi:hypothetical protein
LVSRSLDTHPTVRDGIVVTARTLIVWAMAEGGTEPDSTINLRPAA